MFYLRSVLFCVLYLLFLAVLTPAQLTAQEEFDYELWDQRFQNGQDAMLQQDYSSAVKAFQSAMEVDPAPGQRAATLLLLGRSLTQAGMRDEGVSAYLQIIDTIAEFELSNDGRSPHLLILAAGFMAEDGDDGALLAFSTRAREKEIELGWQMDETFLFHHDRSKADIPSKVGSFKRNKITTFKRGFEDYAVHYGADDQQWPRFTLYISYYPYQGAGSHHNSAAASITQALGAASALEEDDAEPLPNVEGVFGASSSYIVHVSGKPIVTALKVFEIDGWHYKIRATYPQDEAAQIEPEINHFMMAFPWPQPTSIVRPLEAERVGKSKVCKNLKNIEFKNIQNVASTEIAMMSGLLGLAESASPVLPAQNGKKFCVKEKLEVNGKTVNIYAAKKPVGDNRVTYHAEIVGEDGFFQISTPKKLTADLKLLKDVDINGDITQAIYQDSASVSVLQLYQTEGPLPYQIFRRIVVDQIGELRPILTLAAEKAKDESR